MKDASFRVRIMSPEEVALAVDWAAAEGWNPGLNDASCFAAAAPDGYLLGELTGAPAAILSVVNYDAHSPSSVSISYGRICAAVDSANASGKRVWRTPDREQSD